MQATEDFRPLSWTMLGLGVVAILILGLGFATLLRFAPPGQHSGYRAQVAGVYPYDSRSGQLVGAAMTHFRRDQPFAARVEWGQLPASMVVDARWYDSLDSEVGKVGPEPAGRLASRDALVPVITPPDQRANLPGSYTLKIVRYSGSRPVEVLDTENVVVVSSP